MRADLFYPKHNNYWILVIYYFKSQIASISNLREVTSQEQMFNRNIPKNKKDKSLPLGVTFISYTDSLLRPKDKPYLAKIGINYKTIHIGQFTTAEEAHKAYLKAKEKYHSIERRDK